MPGRDGTGPVTWGRGIGRGLGICYGMNSTRADYGLGFGCRGGMRRGLAGNFITPTTSKELLEQQKELMKRRLEDISIQLDCLSRDEKE
ncbi:hypothetical protein SAMN05660297_02096 [Natronincola peptidivorans]|uniref:DUF5320 domain-containing protein n=1 Tax=Natronincola peptidivorans TaxID=426128 RepID=A0A1I0DNK4_9FIRM|nr:DUF5320 domain-containing protein [Natronincola peptidivorans]SET34119.1 hypothetical protein SAMN05660297_02096 [Natronincola peptidivorans]